MFSPLSISVNLEQLCFFFILDQFVFIFGRGGGGGEGVVQKMFGFIFLLVGSIVAGIPSFSFLESLDTTIPDWGLFV